MHNAMLKIWSLAWNEAESPKAVRRAKSRRRSVRFLMWNTRQADYLRNQTLKLKPDLASFDRPITAADSIYM